MLGVPGRRRGTRASSKKGCFAGIAGPRYFGFFSRLTKKRTNPDLMKLGQLFVTERLDARLCSQLDYQFLLHRKSL